MSNPFENASEPQKSGQEPKAGGGAERREAIRRPLRANAMVLLPGQPGRVGKTVDVSETGLCVALTDALPAGTQCLVGFELPDKAGSRKRMQSKARVVHSVLSSQGGFKVGMQLVTPPDDVVRALQSFIRE
ncbi:MAG: PilZ domain-containing protein [Burkholderiales bacterium]|nr:PilZ domain-containing protein [Burkholderiales bacterium]